MAFRRISYCLKEGSYFGISGLYWLHKPSWKNNKKDFSQKSEIDWNVYERSAIFRRGFYHSNDTLFFYNCIRKIKKFVKPNDWNEIHWFLRLVFSSNSTYFLQPCLQLLSCKIEEKRCPMHWSLSHSFSRPSQNNVLWQNWHINWKCGIDMPSA